MKNDSFTRSVLRVTGTDATTFLQGQLCNDIEAVTATAGQLSALSTPKGRVIGVFRILKGDGGYLLTLPRSIAEAVTTVLRRYILRSKVIIEVDPDGLTARTSCTLPHGLTVADAAYACAAASDALAMRLPGPSPLYELVGPQSALGEDTAASAARTALAAGLPDVTTATSGAFVAQMLNLDRLHGISFTKGCYTGQEVIARTQNLGRIKRRMLRFAGQAGSAAPAPGDELVSAGSAATAGKVVGAVPVDKQGFELLAVVRLEAMDNGDLTLHDGTPLSPLEFA